MKRPLYWWVYQVVAAGAVFSSLTLFLLIVL